MAIARGGCAQGSRASRLRVAAVTSVCRIRLSPTRKVLMPTAASAREIGRREDAALADDDLAGRHPRRKPLAHCRARS